MWRQVSVKMYTGVKRWTSAADSGSPGRGSDQNPTAVGSLEDAAAGPLKKKSCSRYGYIETTMFEMVKRTMTVNFERDMILKNRCQIRNSRSNCIGKCSLLKSDTLVSFDQLLLEVIAEMKVEIKTTVTFTGNQIYKNAYRFRISVKNGLNRLF